MLDQRSLDTCSYCPRLCRDVCPVAIGEARETMIPTHKMALTNLWQRGTVPLGRDLAEVFYGCTGCGACTSACKHGIQPAEILYQARQEAFAQNAIPETVGALLQKMERYGNPFGKIQPQSFPAVGEGKLRIYLGCAAGMRGPDEAELLLRAVEQVSNSSVGLLSPDASSGAAAYAMGDVVKARAKAEHLRALCAGTEHLLVADPHCWRHIQTQSSHFGDSRHKLAPKISLLFEYLGEALPALPDASQVQAFYHDSPPVGRFGGYYDEPRKYARRMGYQVLELTRNREQALATGAGGIYRWTSPDGARQSARWFLRELRQHAEAQGRERPAPLLTIGETERSLLAEAEPELEILDLNVLLAEAITS